MTRPVRPVLLLLCGLTSALLLTGCPKRPTTSTASAPAPTIPSPAAPAAPTPSARPPAAAAAPSAPAPVTSAPTAPAAPAKPSEYAATDALKDIYFAFDRYDIRPSEVKTLDANSTWLKLHDNSLVLVEGHCDERGTAEYNMALGERRARTTMNDLVSRGVPASRITLISYGKEHPLCTEHSEACWAKNRRAHFLVKDR